MILRQIFVNQKWQTMGSEALTKDATAQIFKWNYTTVLESYFKVTKLLLNSEPISVSLTHCGLKWRSCSNIWVYNEFRICINYWTISEKHWIWLTVPRYKQNKIMEIMFSANFMLPSSVSPAFRIRGEFELFIIIIIIAWIQNCPVNSKQKLNFVLL